jgi:hypothetical protein
MRAELRGLDFEPEPRALPADPAAFTFQARLYIGPAADRGEESFDVTVCSPEWLAARCQREGVVWPIHHLVVTVDCFDERTLRDWFNQQVQRAEGESWRNIAEQLSRLGHWEFSGYREHRDQG